MRHDALSFDMVLHFKIGFWIACAVTCYSNAFAACKLDSPTPNPSAVNEFLLKPQSMLAGPIGNKREALELSTAVSEIVAAGMNPAVVQAFKVILPGASLPQKEAIGEGFYNAMTHCLRIDSQTASRIETAIPTIGDRDVSLAYARAALLSELFAGSSHLGNLIPSVATKPQVKGEQLIGEPTVSNPGSLKLADPFGSPDIWR
jgi:hypothetical protein